MTVGVDYKVVGQQELVRYDEGLQRVVSGVKVTFSDQLTGTVGSVWVPDAQYPEAADALIMERLRGFRGVHGVQG